ncbi:MAG: hypothetical protein AAFQ58_17680 [Pseudomonadota bacterium]
MRFIALAPDLLAHVCADSGRGNIQSPSSKAQTGASKPFEHQNRCGLQQSGAEMGCYVSMSDAQSKKPHGNEHFRSTGCDKGVLTGAVRAFSNHKPQQVLGVARWTQ